MRVRASATCPRLRRRNILPHVESSYLKSCEYSVDTDPECPIFQLRYMVSEAGEEFQDMAVKVWTNFQEADVSVLRRSDVISAQEMVKMV